MIIVRYRGGLGNQMFQYAFQTALCVRYPEEVIKADLSHYNLQQEHNGFELETVFNVPLQYAGFREVRSVTNMYAAADTARALPPFIKKKLASRYQFTITHLKNRVNKGKTENYYKQKYHNSFEEVLFHLNLSHDWYLDGLWQNLLYFKECQDKIKNEFAFRRFDRLTKEDLQILGELKKESSVCVHVRRGDFVKSKFDLCGEQYYKDALDLISRKVKSPSYYFFTDDAEFVKKEFNHLEHIRVVSHPIVDSSIDMYMMSTCRHNIISNSTFAYWGAYLNGTENQYIIAPKYSIQNKVGGFELSAPDDWIKLEV